jgi:hypothetical protein
MVRCRHAGPLATVPMPEATVDEERQLETRENEVWPAGKIRAVQTVAEARRVNRLPHLQFGTLPVEGTRAMTALRSAGQMESITVLSVRTLEDRATKTDQARLQPRGDCIRQIDL